MKKLYCVSVTSEYYCLAETESEAESFVDEAVEDVYRWQTSAHEVTNIKYIPAEWVNSQVITMMAVMLYCETG